MHIPIDLVLLPVYKYEYSYCTYEYVSTGHRPAKTVQEVIRTCGQQPAANRQSPERSNTGVRVRVCTRPYRKCHQRVNQLMRSRSRALSCRVSCSRVVPSGFGARGYEDALVLVGGGTVSAVCSPWCAVVRACVRACGADSFHSFHHHRRGCVAICMVVASVHDSIMVTVSGIDCVEA